MVKTVIPMNIFAVHFRRFRESEIALFVDHSINGRKQSSEDKIEMISKKKILLHQYTFLTYIAKPYPFTVTANPQNYQQGYTVVTESNKKGFLAQRAKIFNILFETKIGFSVVVNEQSLPLNDMPSHSSKTVTELKGGNP